MPNRAVQHGGLFKGYTIDYQTEIMTCNFRFVKKRPVIFTASKRIGQKLVNQFRH